MAERVFAGKLQRAGFADVWVGGHRPFGIDQAVSPEDQEKVEQHLSFCRRCCGELEFATQLRGLLASQSAEELPPHVKARLERFLADLKEDQWRGI